MKTDLQKNLTQNHADALWITGPAQHNPFMMYLTGGGHITMADVIIQTGRSPCCVMPLWSVMKPLKPV